MSSQKPRKRKRDSEQTKRNQGANFALQRQLPSSCLDILLQASSQRPTAALAGAGGSVEGDILGAREAPQLANWEASGNGTCHEESERSAEGSCVPATCLPGATLCGTLAPVCSASICNSLLRQELWFGPMRTSNLLIFFNFTDAQTLQSSCSCSCSCQHHTQIQSAEAKRGSDAKKSKCSWPSQPKSPGLLILLAGVLKGWLLLSTRLGRARRWPLRDVPPAQNAVKCVTRLHRAKAPSRAARVSWEGNVLPAKHAPSSRLVRCCGARARGFARWSGFKAESARIVFVDGSMLPALRTER